MKTSIAALLALSASSSTTTYSAAGVTPRGVTSSEVSIRVTLENSQLTTRIVQKVSLTTAVSTASYDAESIACFLTEADSHLCAYCKGAYASDTQYEATFATFRWTKTAPKLATAATSLFDAANLQLQGLPVVLPTKNYGTEVDALSRTGYVFVLEKMLMGTDKKTLECIASFTDPTAGTEARETVVKDGMAKTY